MDVTGLRVPKISWQPFPSPAILGRRKQQPQGEHISPDSRLAQQFACLTPIRAPCRNSRSTKTGVYANVIREVDFIIRKV